MMISSRVRVGIVTIAAYTTHTVVLVMMGSLDLFEDML